MTDTYDDGSQHTASGYPPGTGPSRRLPAVPEPTFADTTPLSAAPTVALAFALGAAVTQRVDANRFGPFVAMCQELMARPAVVGDRAISGGQWGLLLTTLPPDVARSLSLLYQMQRGQAWAQTGVRPPVSGK